MGPNVETVRMMGGADAGHIGAVGSGGGRALPVHR